MCSLRSGSAVADPAKEGAPALELRDLSRAFGALRAVDHVSLRIASGTFTSIIGPNGAGKTTLYNLITGRIPPTSGQVLLHGQDITGLAPHRVARRGLARSFQITNVFLGLTPYENVRAAVIAQRGLGRRWFGSVDGERTLAERTWALLEEVGIASTGLAHVPCRALSHGDRRVVEIGIVLAIEPSVILLDEPAAGMNPAESARIVHLLQTIQRATGKTFVLTEHDMRVVFSVSDRVVVMHQGSVLADGSPSAIRANEEVKQAYLGGVTIPV